MATVASGVLGAGLGALGVWRGERLDYLKGPALAMVAFWLGAFSLLVALAIGALLLLGVLAVATQP